MAQPVLKNLRFQLTLDDPKLPKDQWVTLRGDRAQLEALCEVVSSYVQRFLEQSHSSVNEPVLASRSGAIALMPKSLEQDSVPQQNGLNAAGISLKPKGLLSHELILGSLATEEIGPVINLSALQLFDLANALDEYATEIVALPNLQPTRPGWLKSSPAWAQIAAVGLIVVGLSASVAKLFDSSNPKPTTGSQGANSSDQRIANQLPPAATETPATSNQKLPPPPPLGANVPSSPGMPKVTVPPVISASPNSSSTQGSTTKESQNRSITLPQGSIAMNAPSQGNRAVAPSASVLKPELGNTRSAQRSPNAADESGQMHTRTDASQAQNSTAFDTIPQVAEARRYFQQRWKPPQGLTQTLEYTLVVSPNGSIQQIIPLGQAAGDYVDRTNIPLVGEPFVSPIKSGNTAKIRLVLSTDGKVQTFLE
jgi:hypothetical protein